MKSLSVPVRQNILLMLHQLESSRIVLKWAAAPEGKIVKSDVSIAKNYLTDKEMRSLERIVSAYLDLAMERCRHQP